MISTVALHSLFVFGAMAAGQTELRTYDPMSISDMDLLASRLRPHVAHVTAVEKTPKGQPMAPNPRDGFAIVLDKHHVAMLSVILQNTESPKIHGPVGKPVDAKVVELDMEKRVAILRTESDLSKQGLSGASPSPHKTWKEGLSIFSILSTIGEPAVMDMLLTHTGNEDGYQDTPRLDRQLNHGMPVFDSQARFVGYSRAILWDWDKQLIVPNQIVFGAFAKLKEKEAKAKETDKSPPVKRP